MRNQKNETVWLFQKYDGRSFFASGVMEKLHSRNFPMTCIYLEKHSDAPNLLENFGCRVIYIGSVGATKIFNPVVLWGLAKFLRDNKVDILHCHRHKATFYGSLAATIAGTPVVLSHVHGLKRTRSLLRRWENRVLYGIVSKVITVSDAVRKDVMATNPSLSSSKVIAIRNSVDLNRFSGVTTKKQQAREILGLPQDAFVFGTVGRLALTKGQSCLIEAFAKVRQSVPLAHLVFVGSGGLASELKLQAAHLGCLDAVTFAGQRGDVPQVLRAFDSFVLPSIAEGFPGSLLEAMAASLPCIASAVGGIPEIISDEKLGYLVPSKDPDALFEAMIACYNISEQERFRMGQEAHDMVERLYTHDVYTANLEKLYEEELLRTCRE